MATATVSDVTSALGTTGGAGDTTAAGLIAVVLLILLVVEQELIRAANGATVQRKLGALRIAVLPLLATFVAVIVARFVELLPA